MNHLFSTQLNTKLGPLLAITSETHLYLLEFINRKKLDKQINKLKTHSQSIIIERTVPLHQCIYEELSNYFDRKLSQFKTPISPLGTPFQMKVWETLLSIPYGKTISYKELACTLNIPSAYRAVAMANSHNPLAIIIPCHRVINHNGDLGGYAGGIEKKVALLLTESTDVLNDDLS